MITEHKSLFFSIKFISSADDFENVKTGDTVALSGDLVFITTDETKNPGPGFVYLGKRHPSLSLKSEAKLYVWVREEVFDKAQGIKHVRLVLAQDYYLRWGMFHYKDILLIGGAVSKNFTNLEFYRFKKGSLVEVNEYTLPHVDTPQFNVDLGDRLAQIREEYADIRIEWLPPLPYAGQLLNEYDVKTAGNILFYAPVFKTVHLKKRDFPKYVVSSAVLSCLIIFGAYGFVTYDSWAGYAAKKQEFKQEIKGYEDIYYNNKYNLKLLEKRKKYMSRKNPYTDKVHFVNSLVSYLASKQDLVVKQIKVNLDQVTVKKGRRRAVRNRNKEEHDFGVVFHVPLDRSLNALEQSEQMLKDVASNLNVSVKLANYKNIQVKDAKYKARRVFEIKGYL